MYQNIYIDRKNDLIHLWDDKNGYTTFDIGLANYAYRKSETGTYKSMFGDKLEKITRFNPKDPSLFESDVPIETRCLIDIYEDDDEPSTGHRIMYYDIETDSEGGFPDVSVADKEITAIALFDDVECKYTAFILDKGGLLTNKQKGDSEIISCHTEVELLNKFLDKLEQINPTIWTGWNNHGFDDIYVYRRIKRVLGNNQVKRLSPIKICYENKFSGGLVIAGVSSIDYMTLYKKWNIKQEASYSLGVIGKKVVGIDKVDYTGSLNDLFKSDIQKYIDYNLNDVLIVVELERKLQFIEQARQICHKGHVPYDCYNKSSRFLEGAILMYLRRLGKVAKNRPTREEKLEGESDSFEGAYVKSPVPGRYDWVFDLDLTSMYPNIIISLNISPETKIGKIENWDVDLYLKNQLKYVIFENEKIQIDKFKSYLTDNNYSIASNGVMYRTDFVGVIPEILIKWFDERTSLRKKAKEYGDKKMWDKYNEYDKKQKIVKVQLNSIYGVLGLSGWRFYDKDNASAVTLTGQTIIKSTDLVANRYFENELGQLYEVEYEDGTVEDVYQVELEKNNVDISVYER
jgi:DNA polymerase elongation subunit (family B)